MFVSIGKRPFLRLKFTYYGPENEGIQIHPKKDQLLGISLLFLSYVEPNRRLTLNFLDCRTFHLSGIC